MTKVMQLPCRRHLRLVSTLKTPRENDLGPLESPEESWRSITANLNKIKRDLERYANTLRVPNGGSVEQGPFNAHFEMTNRPNSITQLAGSPRQSKRPARR
jgi:hypothetical protein